MHRDREGISGIFDRQEKLLALAWVVGFTGSGWHAFVQGGALADGRQAVVPLLYAAAMPAYLVLRGIRLPGAILWGGLVAGSGLVALAGWTSAAASRVSVGALGAPALGAAALVLVVPGQYYLWASRQGFGPMRFVGAAGQLLVLGVAASVFVLELPFFLDPPAVAAYVACTTLVYLNLRRLEARHYETAVRRAKTLSVTIIAKDEADRIGRCLDSIHGWADEIIVLDSGSTDGTVEVCRGYTDKVFVTDWPGYGPQKQRALERATGDWVLSIDADEELTPELRHDIDRVLDDSPRCVAWKLPWGVVVYGKRLDFGQSARAPLRLFVREGSRFTDAQVHETVIPPAGAIGRLRGRLLHYTQRDFGHALEKVARYGWLGAQKRFAAGRRGGGVFGATLRSAWVFFQIYCIRLGLLDGQPGLATAMLYAQVNFDKYTGLWALRRESRTGSLKGQRTLADGSTRQRL